jgi:hypothetical protein
VILLLVEKNMDAAKERFLRNEFLTMSLLGALGRSRTYSADASDEDKARFRIAFRERLDKASRVYESTVSEDKHCSNMISISEDLTPKFRHCLRSGRLRLGIVQKALNLYLKYLWCVNLIPRPPHCPFDSIVISNLPDCGDINWTSLDTIEEYKKLVAAAQRVYSDKSLSEWELDLWLKQVQSVRARTGTELINVKESIKRIPSKSGVIRNRDKFYNLFASSNLGKVLTHRNIQDMIIDAYSGTNRSSILPADYCYNITNAGIQNFEHQLHLFEHLGDAKYRVLGIDYPFEGPISQDGKQVGEWRDGKPIFY